MSDELDICPFCGAQPLLNEIAPHSHNLTIGGVKFPDHPGSWTIECPACECGMIADTKEAVIAAWNRRAQPAEEVQPVAGERMRAALLTAREAMARENAIIPSVHFTKAIIDIDAALAAKDTP